MSYNILVVDDSDAIRMSLQLSLEKRGFAVKSASGIQAAREAVLQNPESDFDVAILDMRLNDPENQGVTGGDFGIEIARQADFPPEFIIYSGYPSVEYYRLAVRLGAAAYLDKSNDDIRSLVQHARALIMKRGLSIRSPTNVQAMSRLVETSRSRRDAIRRFCRIRLHDVLTKALGAPFVLLVSDSSGTESCVVGGCSLPRGRDPTYDALDSLIFGIVGRSEPFLVNSDVISTVGAGPMDPQLEGAVFFPVAETQNVRVALGLLQEAEGVNSVSEDVETLARVLINFLVPTVSESMWSITERWAGLVAMRRARLSSAAQFCLSVGREQLDVLSSIQRGRGRSNVRELNRLRSLAENLFDVGNLLGGPYGLINGGEERAFSDGSEVEVSDLVQSSWNELEKPDGVSLVLEGICRVVAERGDLLAAISQILRWMIWKARVSGDASDGSVLVCCKTDVSGAEVLFEDRSERLDVEQRAELFDVFPSGVLRNRGAESVTAADLFIPLYLSVLLLQTRYGCLFEDRSEEIAGASGHRFVLNFPLD